MGGMGMRRRMMEEQSDAKAEAARDCIWEVATRPCAVGLHEMLPVLVRRGFV